MRRGFNVHLDQFDQEVWGELRLTSDEKRVRPCHLSVGRETISGIYKAGPMKPQKSNFSARRLQPHKTRPMTRPREAKKRLKTLVGSFAMRRTALETCFPTHNVRRSRRGGIYRTGRRWSNVWKKYQRGCRSEAVEWRITRSPPRDGGGRRVGLELSSAPCRPAARPAAMRRARLERHVFGAPDAC
jgi:hypothetical protein